MLSLFGDQVWFKEVGTGAEVARGGCVLVSFMYQLDQATGVHIKFYFWVCRGRVFLDEVSIRTGGLSKIDALPRVGGHHPVH